MMWKRRKAKTSTNDDEHDIPKQDVIRQWFQDDCLWKSVIREETTHICVVCVCVRFFLNFFSVMFVFMKGGVFLSKFEKRIISLM